MTPRTAYLETFAARMAEDAGTEPRTELREAFLREFAANIAEPDLDDRDPVEDVRIAQALWQQFEQRDGSAPAVEVSNPGGDDRLTIVTILHPDMPFITDSVLMDLSRHQLVLRFLHNFTVTVERDAHGQVTALPGGRGPVREVLIHAEIDRVPDAELEPIRARLVAALADVRAAVVDYEPMQARLRALIAELATASDAEAQQAVEFLDWLLKDHFTFLGYREFEFGATVRQVPGSALGVLRNRPEASERNFAELRESARDFLCAPARLAFSKGGTRSLVHRPAYPDYVAVKRFDEAGNVVG
jgi:glutamate dehydrogenase